MEHVQKMLMCSLPASVIYYEEYEKSYVYLTCTVAKVNSYFEMLQGDNRAICFTKIVYVVLV